MQGLPISIARRSPRTRGFTLVEVMVVVVVIGLLVAMSLPAYRRITMRSKTAAVVNDLRAFSTAFITYSLQNGHYPPDGLPQEIPAVMIDALPTNFALKTPIGGVYKWNFGVSADGITANAAIIIETAGGETVNDDADLWEMIDREMDDGDLTTGNVRKGSTNSLVFIIEK